MQKLLAKLERKYGRYAPANLTYYLIGIQGIVFFFEMMKPGFQSILVLNSDLILQGQYWRLITWLVIPPSRSPLFFIFALYWLYVMGTYLESHWGAFSYLLYWLVGWVGSTIVAFVLHVSLDNTYILMSLFLAFATLWPDFQLMLFFIFPVPVKWLAIVDAILILSMAAMLEGWQKLIPIAVLANYLLFFGPHLFNLLRGFSREGFRAGVRHQFKQNQKSVENEKRSCALCGVTSDDPSQEFRMCDCEKCGEPKEFCLKHVWEH
ncbi:MAG: hypothetical protein HQM15_06240 [Deltaproteobacteria bacterium]|nr:hypothetical protein [Deltaproteobacteria bacterium]